MPMRFPDNPIIPQRTGKPFRLCTSLSITTVWQLFRLCYLPCFKWTSANTPEYTCNPDWCSSSPLRCYHGMLLGLIWFVQKLLHCPPAVIVACMHGCQTHVCTIAGTDPTALLGLDIPCVRSGNTTLASAGHGWWILNRAERCSTAEVKANR